MPLDGRSHPTAFEVELAVMELYVGADQLGHDIGNW